MGRYVERYYIPDNDVLECVEEFLALMQDTIVYVDEQSSQCRVCNGVDYHEPDCFILAIEAWQQAPAEEKV